jgi:hypothetical protein
MFGYKVGNALFKVAAVVVMAYLAYLYVVAQGLA